MALHETPKNCPKDPSPAAPPSCSAALAGLTPADLDRAAAAAHMPPAKLRRALARDKDLGVSLKTKHPLYACRGLAVNTTATAQRSQGPHVHRRALKVSADPGGPDPTDTSQASQSQSHWQQQKRPCVPACLCVLQLGAHAAPHAFTFVS